MLDHRVVKPRSETSQTTLPLRSRQMRDRQATPSDAKRRVGTHASLPHDRKQVLGRADIPATVGKLAA